MVYWDSSLRELSNGGHGNVVTLLVRSGIDVSCVYFGRAIQLYGTSRSASNVFQIHDMANMANMACYDQLWS